MIFLPTITKEKTRVPIRALILLLFFCFNICLSGCSNGPNKTGKNDSPPKKRAVPVLIGIAEKKTVPVEINATGTVEAYATVAVKSQVTGILQNIHFKEGSDVKTGDLLFTLDPRPFIALKNQAEGALIRDKAQLENARKELERYANAAKKGYVSTEQAEQSETKVATLLATIKADEAAVENARLQVEFCSITAPIDGRTGEVTATEGNLIKANADTAMITINKIHPIKISFTVPGKYYNDIMTYKEQKSLKVILSKGDDSVQEGAVIFIDNAIDQTTGTLKIKGEFPNNDNTLWPGQFISIRLHLTARPDQTVVPNAAVQIGQNGAHVFVVKDDQTVEDRQVVTGIQTASYMAIESGISPGEQVITDGQLQLVTGSKIVDRSKQDTEKADQKNDAARSKS